MRNTTIGKLCSGSILVLALLVNACGGGAEEEANNPAQPPPVQWPQSVTFTDFTGEQRYFIVGIHYYPKADECRTCIAVRGIARNSVELGNLRPDKTSVSWPAPYNDKLYSELPINYNNKIAVVLEDLGYNPVYRYSIQKVEETANTVTISMTKCTITTFLDGILSNNAMQFGVLLPKTDKPINVLTVQTGKPPAFGQPADGLGEC